MDFSLTSPADEERRRRLRRMKVVSLSLLIVAAIIYLLTLRLDHGGVWGYVNTAAEAAMVGGLADWFAVTALFRHPLGIPIPHTAIIPRKKDDLAHSLQDFFAENFLTEDVVRERVGEAQIARRLGEWLQEPAHAHRVVAEGVRLGRAALQRVGDEDVRVFAEESILPRLSAQPIAGHLGSMLDRVVREDRHRGLVNLTINELGRWLLANPKRFTDLIGDRAPTWAPEFVNGRVANYAYKQAVEWLIAVRNDPDHAARKALNDLLLRVAKDLQQDTTVRHRVEDFKAKVLTQPETADAVVGIWRSLRSGVEAAMDDDGSALWTRTQGALERLGARVATSEHDQQRVDAALGDVSAFLVRSYGHELSAVISHTIQRWDGQEASRKIELHVGRDLQFIRINGTIVGALAGLIIHTLSQLLA
ncbi:DUF445 domain-containing protein [Nigerium massiliense]|uniref:DUF445 domain-containing protein n=1 Tax=Nigerium massiliense TaxID=1522317 RepID=UPI00058E3D05|nr:DUF445 domain-containing protein [Nigerium massiliense]